MEGSYKTKVTISSTSGTCARGHKIGDSWIFDDKTPDGMCLSAFASLLPWDQALRWGGEFSFTKDREAIDIVCPDPNNHIIFKVEKL